MPVASTSIHNLNVSLGEFCEHYRTSKDERVTPGTLKDYFDNINRWLRDEQRIDVSILTDEYFLSPGVGNVNAANRISSEQQASGIRPHPYKLLTDKDVQTILEHPCWQTMSPVGYVHRLMVILGMFLGIRTTRFRNLDWTVYHGDIDHNEKACIR